MEDRPAAAADSRAKGNHVVLTARLKDAEASFPSQLTSACRLEGTTLANRLAAMKTVLSTHGSFLIRHQRGHPGVVLPHVISNSANHSQL